LDTNRDENTEKVDTTDVVEADGTEQEGEKKRGRGCGCWIALLVVLLLGAGGAAYVGGTTILRTEHPLPLEEQITDLAKRWLMIPGDFADRHMPNKASVNVATGEKLFTQGDPSRQLVSCTLCHYNVLGASMYPPAPDLGINRVQTKSEGQLFWLIAHGVNLTGMPAFGNTYFADGKLPGYTDDELWSLVKYIKEGIPKTQ